MITRKYYPTACWVALIGCLTCLVAALSSVALAAPPDLTNGGVPTNSLTVNLGPTGLRGWMYHESWNSEESLQILVKGVDAGSPAAGILAVDDVILGADGTGADPVSFTADARKSFANAINDAEARNPATLKVLRWRGGTTTTETLTLRTMGAYSATAPYNCPKSAQILEEGLQYIMSSETSGTYSFGTLGLLAGNDPLNPNNAARMARAQTEARARIPNAATLTKMMSDTRDANASVWERGHTLIMLAEYYLLTGDTQVLPAIQAYAVNIAKNQSLFGTAGHIYADPWPDGSLNGPMGGYYGVVNSSGLPSFLGLCLAKQCGITDAEIDPAIERTSRFFAYYANRSSIPYGEHEPGPATHESNGKSGLAALTFALQPSRAMEARFFSKMATAAASEREIGHTGAFFNYLWSPLGAAAGGEEAAAAHFNRIRWMLDLSRKWNGSFDYDCLYGQGPNSGATYHDFRMSTAALLTYALPLRQLHITGRGHTPGNLLDASETASAVAADGYDPSTRTVAELVTDLGNWSPIVRDRAVTQLGTRTLDSATINQIIGLATDPNGTARPGACLALGKINDWASTPIRASTLASLLTDPQNDVRRMAAQAMRFLSTEDKRTHLNTILAAAASTAQSLLPLVEEDPLHFAHGQLALLLFSGGSGSNAGVISGSNVALAPKNLLYPAIKAVAANPIGYCRSSLATVYPHLTEADFRAVAGAVVDAARERTPADRMFSRDGRIGGVKMMQRLNQVAEGVPVALAVMNDDRNANEELLAVLKLYAGSSNTVVPDPDVDGFCLNLIEMGQNAADAQLVLDAIAADPNPAPLIPLKSIQSVTADNPTLTLPAQWTTLRTTSNDYADGTSVYTWRKIRGAGNVSFTPNGTTGSKNTAVLFDGTPGQYLFEVTMSDSRGLTEVTSTVAATLYQSGGTLPPNNPPVADNQSPSIPQATPTPLILTGSDPEGHALDYQVTSQPAHGKLTGSAPYLVYTSDFSYTGADSFNFEVIDSEGQVSTATVSITVTAASSFPVAVYEPFNMTSGTLLHGQAGGVGLIGNWVGSGTLGITAGNLAFGDIPTSGNRLLRAGGNGRASINLGTTLANAGLLNDGAVLWFSFLHREPDNNVNAQPAFLFGSSSLSSFYNQISSGGSGIGLRIGSGKSPQPIAFNAGSYSEGEIQATIGVSQTALIVGKITWGATPGATDTIEIYTPRADLLLDTPTSHSAVLNQASFNVISMWGNGPCPEFDEIRFGPNYASVLNGNAPMTADTIAPLPGTMAFHQTPTVASTSSIRMVAVTAYDPNGIEYYFTCTAGGGNDSGWQDSPSYTDSGLTPGVLYSYTVMARDKSPARNATTPSSASSATIDTQTTLPNLIGMQQTSAESIISTIGMTVGVVTLVNGSALPPGTVLGQSPTGDQIQPLGTVVNLTVAGEDTIAPTPNPATFAVAPVAINSSTITMTATTGSDPSGVEYLFTETTGNPGSSSSAWQDSPVFTDNGLSASTLYTYTVTLRDKSPAANATAASPTSSATTPSIPAAPTWYWDGGTTDIASNGNGASAGGTGTWNTTLRNWDAGNIAHTEWNNAANKTAVFGGTAGTVTIGGGGVTVGDLQFTSATYTLKGDPLTVSGTSNLQINVAANMQSVLTGNFGLTKAGTGTLTLSAANTYTGDTTVTGGTLAAGATNFLPVNSNVTVNPGGTFQYAVGGNFNALNVALNGGTLQASGGGTMPGIFTLGTGTTSTVNNSNGFNTLSGNLTGAGNLNILGASRALVLSGTNTHTGTTTLTGGWVIYSKPAALYNGVQADWTAAKIKVNSGTALGIRGGDGTTGFTSAQVNTLLGNLCAVNNNGLMSGSNILFDTTTAAFNHTGSITDSSGTGGGAVGVQVYGGNLLTLSGANTYSGKTVFRPFNATPVSLSVSSFNSVNGGTPLLASSSLGAPTTVANGTIQMGDDGFQTACTLTYTGTGETTDRILHIAGNTASTMTLIQAGSGLLKFTSAFTKPGSNATPLVLRGAGNGEIAGLPAYGTLTKWDAGTWTIAGANATTGVTTVRGGALVLAHANALPGGIGATGGSNALTFNGGVIGLGAGNFSRPLAAAGTVGTANFTGAGGWAAYGADLAVNVGGASASITWATANTGFNAQTLILGNPTATHTVDFQNPLDLGTAARTVQADNGTAAIDGKLSGVLSGSGGALTKSGLGTLVLTNANTYTGVTNVNAGTLLIDGNQSAATGGITVAAGATLGGTGTLGGNLTVANGGGLTFGLSTPAGSHDMLDLVSGKTLAFSGSSAITITSIAGASPGIYTLVSGGNTITGVAPATVNMPAGWAATASISGSSLLLHVIGPVDHFAISSIASPQTVGTPITGITITAQDAANQTVTNFTGTVTFGGTAGVAGTSASFVAGILSGVSVTPTATGSNLTFTVDDGSGHTGSATFTVQTLYEFWAAANGLTGGNALQVSNPDGDTLNNLQEFAFGTNPTAASGSIVFITGGAVITPGAPVAVNMLEGQDQGVDYRAIFGRRKDHTAAGLTYSVQFSADFTAWVTSTATPTVLTDPGAGNPGPIEAVSVPYPSFIAVPGGFRKPTFFRVGVSEN